MYATFKLLLLRYKFIRNEMLKEGPLYDVLDKAKPSTVAAVQILVRYRTKRVHIFIEYKIR